MSYGIPYMGSKDNICSSLALNFPKAEHFYDLFGGGFSITHYMIVNKSNKYSIFHYNEIKKDIPELVKKAINGDFNYNRFKPPWISREDFLKYKDTDSYIRCCWSFGNNQTDYLFGKYIEEYKRSMHMAIIFDDFNNISESVFGFNKWPKEVNTITKKRLYLRQKIEWLRVRNKIPDILKPYLPKHKSDNLRQLEQLERLQQLQRLQRLQQLEQLQQLGRLQRLQQLERLQQLQRLQRLTITALDYREIEILPNSIIYCDIPYKNTADYGEFNHNDFFNWASSRKFPVYISEYNISDKRFELIYEVDKRVMLTQSGDSNKIKSEKLYWNRVSL